MKKTKPTFKLWEVLLITLVGSLVMGLATGYVVYTNIKTDKVNIKTTDEDVNLFLNAYNSIMENYYGDIDKKELINAAISGMTEYLNDPYTTYLNEPSKELLLDSLNGSYEGIGVEIRQDEETNIIEVMMVFENTPASKARIQIGDILTAVNGEKLIDKKLADAILLIKSSVDGKVEIEVSRNDATHLFNLTLADVNIPITHSEVFTSNEKKIGFIGLEKFTSTAPEQFKEALEKLEKENIDSLIIDLRNNTGGFLSGATDISKLFLKKGQIIYSLKSKLKTTPYKDDTKEERSYPVVVLINSGSASASEILAGALKYNINATTIGTKSYGKGKVQQTSTLKDGSMIKYTSAEWLMPNGKGIDGIGITPDIEVAASEAYNEFPTKENDNQLTEAINHLSK